jgi:hypothetical protein
MTSMKTSKALKYLPTFCLVAILLAGSARAQERRVEVSPFAGIQVGGNVLSRPGRLEIESDPVYGVIVDIRVRPDATIQALYGRQDTTLDFLSNDPFFPRHVRVGLAVEYYHLGGAVEFGEGRFRPYFALTVGATRFDPKVEDVGSEWRFSIGSGVGFKTYLSPRFGLRAEGRVWPTFLQTSGGFLCSLPGACLVSVEADFLTQGSATGGVFVTF